jgi:hypothetical protein
MVVSATGVAGIMVPSQSAPGLSGGHAMTDHLGGCLCGDIRFRFAAPSLWCAHCHCSLCQRAHGAPLVTWVGVKTDSLRFIAGHSLHWYRSSADSERGFCSRCGSTLFFRSARWPGETHIVRSNIDGELDRQPSVHVHCESAADWFPFQDELPRESS